MGNNQGNNLVNDLPFRDENEDYGDDKPETDSENSEAEKETGDENWPEEKILARSAKRKKRKEAMEKTVKAKKSSQQKLAPQKKEEGECKDCKPQRRRGKEKKKTVQGGLQPGRPVDLQELLSRHLQDQRSVLEVQQLEQLEQLQLQDSCFLSSNDLTTSLSSYLQRICPRWAKIQKQHREQSSVVVLIVCSSALRAVELTKQLTAFRAGARVLKLLEKHTKVEQQVKLLQKDVVHIGVGTPGRIGALVHADELSLRALKFLVLDWNWRDHKLQRMVDIPEIRLDFLKLLDAGILAVCREERVKIGLF
ncbi:protein CMSS1-like [Cololabis saira]|uniref:protein CMSS1-like n=1 Tax=Cololabis saira TaxID=129043 RepID=UPI002AD40E3B|nr:protein CMSS1-like [Cololabis saira]